MIFRLVAIATYLILTDRVIGGPVTPKKPDSVNLVVERQKLLPKTDNENILLTDGIYLFGQSHKPNQIQNEYFVFKVQNGRVIGALYLPHSAYYCFYGIHQPNRLDVKVIDSYDNTASPYTVNLQQYYRLNQVSDNDNRILNTCENNHQNLAR